MTSVRIATRNSDLALDALVGYLGLLQVGLRLLHGYAVISSIHSSQHLSFANGLAFLHIQPADIPGYLKTQVRLVGRLGHTGKLI